MQAPAKYELITNGSLKFSNYPHDPHTTYQVPRLPSK